MCICIPKRNHKSNRKSSNNNHNPPPVRTSIIFRHKFRWLATNATSEEDNISTISGAQLLRILVQGGSLGGSDSIIRSVRIVSCELWGMYCGNPNETINPNKPVTVYIEYPNTSNTGPGGPDARKADTSMGSAVPAHVRYAPPRGSLSSMWLTDSSQPVLVLRYPRHAILDVTLDVVLEDSTGIKTTGTTGAVPGQNYLLAIDHGGGGYFWVPVGYNTTQ